MNELNDLDTEKDYKCVHKKHRKIWVKISLRLGSARYIKQ